MSNESLDENKIKKQNELLNLFLNSDDDVRLSDDEKLMLLEHPKMLSALWKQSQQAILLHSFPEILSAQIEKGKKGDTTSAKFLSEFINPTDEDDSGERATEAAKWESKAIELRDRLELEYSAQELIELLLDSLLNSPLDVTRQLLQLDA